MLIQAAKRFFWHGRAARAQPAAQAGGRMTAGKKSTDSKAQKRFLAEMQNFFSYDGSEQLPIDENLL